MGRVTMARVFAHAIEVRGGHPQPPSHAPVNLSACSHLPATLPASPKKGQHGLVCTKHGGQHLWDGKTGGPSVLTDFLFQSKDVKTFFCFFFAFSQAGQHFP